MEMVFPARWVFAQTFEDCLGRLNPHQTASSQIEIKIPAECKVAIHVALWLLSLINQLIFCGRHVVLSFDSVEGAYSYLSRVGFFDRLANEVEVRPHRPDVSGAMIYGGGNPELVEIHEVPHDDQRAIRDLPSLLAGSLRQSLRGHPKAEIIEAHLATVLTEVIDNVYQHSGTPLSGLVALQPYKNAAPPTVLLAISDSGYGITHTLRKAEPQTFQHMTDTEMIVKVFREGLSRFGFESGRGGGLCRSAAIALRYGADLHVRVPTAIVRLVPSRNGYQESTAYCHDSASLLWGTHLCFEFQLTSD